MVIGLTGGIGSGKSTVANYFATFENVSIYNADKEAKMLMTNSNDLKEKITSLFGKNAYVDNTLNRKFIANIVFNDIEKLEMLNSIVHPAVHEHLEKFILTHKANSYILYENAILFENNSQFICDKIITVTAPKELRIQRVMKRDTTTKKAVEERMKNQWEQSKKVLQSHYIIHNTNLLKTQKNILRIHNILTTKLNYNIK